ncbi:MAG TPA: ABC transporter substrate-binding protein [Actinomycetota bacterium]|nr:ABC transporter substrate-binding protein [Actinomycetota bacterium]
MDQSSETGAEIRTFLIADVRGYTLFTQERGDEAAAKLAAKFAGLAREAVEARGGSVIELRGDEALAVFSSPRQALRASVELEIRFVEETVANPSLPLPVGIGLDAGEAVPIEGGYRGGPLNRAARLCGQAGPGEVLASAEVVYLAGRVEGIRYVDRGSLHLKGLADPVRVMRVLPELDEDPATRLSSLLPPPRPSHEPEPSAVERAGIWRLFRHGLRSRRGLAVGLALLLVAFGLPLILVSRGGKGGTNSISANAVGLIDLQSGRLSGQIAVGARPGAIASGTGAVWVVNEEANTVSKIDPATRQAADTIEVGTDPVGVAVGAGAVWVANSGDGTLMRIDPQADKVVDTIEVGNGPVGVAFGLGSVWVANSLDGTITRIAPDSDAVTDTFSAGANPTSIVVGKVVWVTNSTTGKVSRIDPRSGALITSTPVGNGPAAVAGSGDDVWVANNLDGTVSRLDPGGAVAATIPVGNGPSGIAIGGGSVWVANEEDGTVSQVDPATNTAGGPIEVGSAPSGLTVVQGTLWVTARGSGAVHQGGTLRVVSLQPNQLDPVAVSFGPGGSILSVTNDGLLGFRRAGGVEGAKLIPDLATSVPDPTDGGSTYTFQLRQGIRYSTGKILRAQDVRFTFERGFKIGFPVNYYDRIVGADSCVSKPEKCDLSRGIVTDDASGTVTFHLASPDPEFPFKLAVQTANVVPFGTPIELTDMIPATGPYMVKSRTEKVIELVRNPYFREWSKVAQPEGYPDRVVATFRENTADTLSQFITDIEAGKADASLPVLGPGPPIEMVEELRRRYPTQVHSEPQFGGQVLFLNTRVPPFDDPQVRRAINYAVDRNKMVEIFGSARPTCQLLPPNSPGYDPYCPFTLNSGPDGRYSGPDLAKAHRLVGQSGTAGMKVTLLYAFYWPREGGRYLVSMLEDLGYRATLEVGESGAAVFGAYSNSKTRTQMGIFGWGADYPAASSFINQFLSCRSFVPQSDLNQNFPEFCDPAIDRQINQALTLQVTDPSAASKVWATIDRALVDRAPLVPLFYPERIDFVSKRVGNYQHHPTLGILIDQVWVR